MNKLMCKKAKFPANRNINKSQKESIKIEANSKATVMKLSRDHKNPR